MDVQDAILAIFECPICKGYMRPPIRMCTLGHSFCRECGSQVSRCPTCRQSVGVARNFALEKIHNKLTFPCNYADEGCTFKAAGMHVALHELRCDAKEIHCPLKCVGGCPWFGKVSTSVAHCLEKHPNNASAFSSQKFVIRDFFNLIFTPEAELRMYTLIMEGYGTIFKCECLIDYGHIITRWKVSYMGPREDYGQYSYRVQFENADGDVLESSRVAGVCEFWQEQPSFTEIMPFRGQSGEFRSGELFFTVTILKVISGIPADSDGSVKEPIPFVEAED